ncbi:MAG: P-II family nitrogen regulator [Desulfobacterales bacterium]
MKEIMAIIRLNMMNKTKQALTEAGVSSMTAKDALGRGKGLVDIQLLKGAEQGYEEAIIHLGQTQRLIPKRLLTMVVQDEMTGKVIDTITRINQTGKSGDGKIFVMPVIDSISVRTGVSGNATLDDL